MSLEVASVVARVGVEQSGCARRASSSSRADAPALNSSSRAGAAGLPAFLRGDAEQRRVAVGSEALVRESEAHEQIEPERDVLGSAHVVELAHLAKVVLDELQADPRIDELAILGQQQRLWQLRGRCELDALPT